MSAILLEDGSTWLLEDGSDFLLEEVDVAAPVARGGGGSRKHRTPPRFLFDPKQAVVAGRATVSGVFAIASVGEVRARGVIIRAAAAAVRKVRATVSLGNVKVSVPAAARIRTEGRAQVRSVSNRAFTREVRASGVWDESGELLELLQLE